MRSVRCIEAMIQNIEDLSNSLEITKNWCDPLIDISNPESCLRTRVLEKYLAKSQGIDFEKMSFWPTAEEIDRTLSIKKAVFSGTKKSPSSINLGRLLLSIPEQTNFNGLSNQESNGYLDDHDNTPWDTWVGQFEINDYEFLLLSWVPEEFVENVELGIQAECIGMIHWANSEYWAEYTTPNNEFLNCVPKWLLEHESANT